MSVDVEIYMNNLVKFFKENPKDLLNLVPKEKEEEFYIKIKEVAYTNHEKGEDAPLTQKQLIDICRVLNGRSLEDKGASEKKIYSEEFLDDRVFVKWIFLFKLIWWFELINLSLYSKTIRYVISTNTPRNRTFSIRYKS